MNFLVLGGTGFIGPATIRRLLEAGHSVTALHRGKRESSLPQGVQQVIGNAKNIAQHRKDIQRIAPDVVIHFILSSGREAEAFMGVMSGVVKRVVVLSSMDVYRAVGITHGLEAGPLEPLPLTEDSPLRTNLHPYPPQVLARLHSIFEWVDDEYDKIPAERMVLNDKNAAGTVLRLPMVYGPGDPLHRFYPILKRILDGRRRIVFAEDMAAWCSPRGHVENVAAAIALAASSEKAAGRIYNVAEWPAYSELEWAKKIAAAMNWDGDFIVLPRERTPKHLLQPGNNAQHWVASSERIRSELGYNEALGLEDAIRGTIAWESSNPPSEAAMPQFDYAAEDAA